MIREYKKEDIETIANIWLDASIIAHNFISASYWESKLDDMKSIYIPNSHTLVYTDTTSGEVIGFISLVDNFIAAVFVSPAHQGKGIGKQLISRAKELHNSLELSVYAENKDSIEFYKKQGFAVQEEKIEENTGHKELMMLYSKI